MSPADSMATSVPAPMAMPTSARARAGRVVDAVADHGDLQATGLQLGDLGRLVLGEHLGEHLVDAEVAADGLGDLAGVAGDHHDPCGPCAWSSVTAARASGRTSSSSASAPTISSPRTR